MLIENIHNEELFEKHMLMGNINSTSVWSSRVDRIYMIVLLDR